MYIGLDISKNRIGVSVGYVSTNKVPIVTPYKLIENYLFKPYLVKELFTNLKKNFKINHFIIGLPSSKYENYKFIKNFVHKYRIYLKPFIFINEDYSSFSIEHVNNKNIIFKHNQKDDFVSSIILEKYLLENKCL